MLQRLAPWIALPDDDQGTRVVGWRVPRWMRVAASTALLIALFTALRYVAMYGCRLPEAAFAEPSILGACVAHRGLLMPGGLTLYLLIALLVDRLRQPWDGLDGGRWLQLFVGGLAVVLAWAAGAYPYNFWYAEWHLVDRVALGALAGLVVWRPVFVFPFTVVYWALMWQFDFPPLGFQVLLAEFKPAVHTLTAFAAVFLVQSLWRERSMHAFLFLALCIVAGNFWVPAYAKLQIGWVSHGDVHLLLPNAYTHGWLAFLGPDTVARAASALSAGDWPARVATLALESAALLLLLRAGVTRVLLAALTGLLGVFFVTIGFFFWKWLLLQAGLWVLLFRAPPGDVWRQRLFTPARFGVSVVMIAAAPWWIAPAALAWFDTPLANTLTFEATGASGTTYELPPRFFAPYESHLAMGTFVGAVTPAPLLAGPYGATGLRETAEALVDARTPDDVLRLEAQAAGRGVHVADEGFARTFDTFVQRAVTEHDRTPRWLTYLRPPPFLWTFPRGRPYRGQEPIVSVDVRRLSSFYDGRRYHVLRRELLRTIAVRPSAGAGSARGAQRTPLGASGMYRRFP